MNNISRKLLPVLLGALTVIVATGCASKTGMADGKMDGDKMHGMSDGKMEGMMDSSSTPGTSASSTMAATSGSSAMPGTSESKMPGTPDSSIMPATPDSSKMPPGTSDGSKLTGTSAIKLDGSQEVPPVKTKATGDGTVTVAADKSVSGSIMTTGIKAQAAHIHEGAAGTNGPVIVKLAKSADNRWSVPAGATLTDKQYASYMAGNLYVNVHSAAHPDGEIRAQLNSK